jgi:DNA-binding MarR family transcriptional regulator
MIYLDGVEYGGSLLAAELRVDPVVTSRALARLQRFRLVVRRQTPRDYRMKIAKRTAAGNALMQPFCSRSLPVRPLDALDRPERIPMPSRERRHGNPNEPKLAYTLRAMFIALSRQKNLDFTARQLAVFLICYLGEDEQTVRGLAIHLKLSKSVISRAFDKFEERRLVTREPDPRDRRNIFAGRTPAGLRLYNKLQAIAQDATAAVSTDISNDGRH